MIVGSIAAGDTAEQILKGWPQLTPEDIVAALRFAAALAAEATAVPKYDDSE